MSPSLEASQKNFNLLWHPSVRVDVNMVIGCMWKMFDIQSLEICKPSSFLSGSSAGTRQADLRYAELAPGTAQVKGQVRGTNQLL